MIDHDGARKRAAMRAQLPALTASTERLGQLLQSLLSPAVVAALTTGAGPVELNPAVATAAARDASVLLRRLDAERAGLPRRGRTTPGDQES